jgi:DHA1 family bicyclomycin/chloramphenicol resistance-like MFS transporter
MPTEPSHPDRTGGTARGSSTRRGPRAASGGEASAPTEARPDTDRRAMLLACLLVFTAQMATTVYLPSLPAVAAEFDISRSYAALSVSLFVVGAAVPVVAWGALADRYGRREALLASLVLFVATSAALTVVASPVWLLVLRTFEGVGAGGAAIIARIVVRDRSTGDVLARRLAVLSIAFITALGGGQFIGGLIGRHTDWGVGFAVLAVLGVLAGLGAFTVPMEPGGPRREGGAAGVYLALLRRPAFLAPAVAGGLGFAVIVLLQETAPFTFQHRFDLTVDQYGTVGLLFGLAYFAGAFLVNRIVVRTGKARLMRGGALVMTAAGAGMVALWLLGLPQGTALAVFTALYFIATFGQSVLFPNSMAAAVSEVAGGPHAVALCGCLQQSIAGVAAAFVVFLHHELAWSSAALVLAAAAWLLVRRFR